MDEAKPVRVEGDPEGYEAVFGGECSECGAQLDGVCRPGVPCTPWRRPEGRGVHYVRKERAMDEAKPVRVEGDPEGYEAVFDGQEDTCVDCGIRGTDKCWAGIPCQSYKRPEGRSVHYVRVRNPEPEKGRNAWDIGKELDSGAWYRSAESSLWFRDWRQAGMIDAVRINGKEYWP